MRRHWKFMRADPCPDSGTSVSLPFFSFLSKLPDDSAISPPPSTQSSVPFRWEEAPGKPKMFSTPLLESRASLTLKLPPRLYGEGEASLRRISSSSIFLRRTSINFSLPSSGSSGSDRWSPINADQLQQPSASFSSWEAMGACGGKDRSDQEMELLDQDGDGNNAEGVDTMIRIKKGRRRWRFMNFFHSKSHSWVRSK